MQSSNRQYPFIAIILLSAAHLWAAASDSKPAIVLTSSSSNLEAAVIRPAPERGPAIAADPCANPELQPNSMSPTWNRQAGTVQCGALETDNMTVLQPMDDGISQWTIGTTAKYGLTPRLELRWALPGRISQGGNGLPAITGITDHSFGALFHFYDQHQWAPDLAFDYAFKVPAANPAKGFGSGYSDHSFTFIASRDIGASHLDFNTVGTLAGAAAGYDGAAQLGLGYSRTFSHHVMGTVEAFGGSQPGTSNRYGAMFVGGSWGLRPFLALNEGFIHSYTAGCPRSLYMFGFIYTVRPGFALHSGSRLSRILGR